MSQIPELAGAEPRHDDGNPVRLVSGKHGSVHVGFVAKFPYRPQDLLPGLSDTSPLSCRTRSTVPMVTPEASATSFIVDMDLFISCNVTKIIGSAKVLRKYLCRRVATFHKLAYI